MPNDSQLGDPMILKGADVIMDLQSHTVFRGKKSLKLARKEFEMLQYLMRNSGMTVTRTMILENVWDMNAIDPFTNTVDVHIRYLRRKLGDDKRRLIETVPGYGYKFAV